MVALLIPGSEALYYLASIKAQNSAPASRGAPFLQRFQIVGQPFPEQDEDSVNFIQADVRGQLQPES